jgi:hypothetical protein
MLPLHSTETRARTASTEHHHFKMSGGNAELAEVRFICYPTTTATT